MMESKSNQIACQILNCIKEDTSPEAADALKACAGEVEALGEQLNKHILDYNELSKKYVASIKQTGFKQEENKEDDNPMTLEEIANKIIKEKK